jgi:ppGpp synthetase/RelA/SpoT-type nucleotidyltranferase
MEFRLKTIRSILQKMWETEEYTNENAIRDMIGIAFI